MKTMMTSSNDETDYFLNLCDDPIRFEPASAINSVFYDECGKQVFAVRSGGATGVIVKSPVKDNNHTFQMEDKGSLASLKLSPDQKILALQRHKNSVEFLNVVNNELSSLEYSQQCKGKHSIILGYIWVSAREILFITNNGLEFYHVYAEKQSLKCLKTLSMNVAWYEHSAITDTMLVATGSAFHPVLLCPGNVVRLPKFSLDSQHTVTERDVALAQIYGENSVLFLKHQLHGSVSVTVEIVIYTVTRETGAKKSHVLKVDQSGRVAINVVDNLVILHHQPSQTSLTFDVNLPGESDGYVIYHEPVTFPLPIKPQELDGSPCTLYSTMWVAFQPDVIIDAKTGSLWHLHLNLPAIVQHITNKLKLVQFLVGRGGPMAKSTLLRVLYLSISPEIGPGMCILAKIFDLLNGMYRVHLDKTVQSQMGLPAHGGPKLPPLPAQVPFHMMVCDQSDMYMHVFLTLVNEYKNTCPTNIRSAMIEYLRSLGQFHIPVQHFIIELLIDNLVTDSAFYQLHQLLQYNVIPDSKPMACTLLALRSMYEPAHQVALDMLKRLGTANEEILEILLSNFQIISAIRFMEEAEGSFQSSFAPKKFLEAALTNGNPLVFHSVFKYLQMRNLNLRNSPEFIPSEACDVYVNKFMEMFGADA